MKSLVKWIKEDETNMLDEAALRTAVRIASVLSIAATSRRSGNDAVRHLKDAQRLLQNPIPEKSDDIVDIRFERLEKSLAEICNALIAIRRQLGGTTGVATSSALLADRVSKQLKHRM